MRCDCENQQCKVGHALGGCQNKPAQTPVLYGRLCEECAKFMPDEYKTAEENECPKSDQ